MIYSQSWNDDLSERDPALFIFLRDYEAGTTSAAPTHEELERKIWKLKQDLLIQIYMQRRKRHLTQQMLADTLGVAQSSIARLESGKGNPSLSTLLTVIAALGVRIELCDQAGPSADLLE